MNHLDAAVLVVGTAAALDLLVTLALIRPVAPGVQRDGRGWPGAPGGPSRSAPDGR
ncbi:hypothetical protein [Micromonospora sp. HK10]|uniref:hypothetical protein n=1 Tax=Micromonospora sp. HK10 TaxID=1538294 RepID=UPI0012E253A6|nr:hypothetical protein [Micromonospora sp. HK10]